MTGLRRVLKRSGKTDAVHRLQSDNVHEMPKVHDGLNILRAHLWEDYEATTDRAVSEVVFCMVYADAVVEYFCTDCSAMTCLH